MCISRRPSAVCLSGRLGRAFLALLALGGAYASSVPAGESTTQRHGTDGNAPRPVITSRAPQAVTTIAPREENGLQLDAAIKRHAAKLSDETSAITFNVKNTSNAEIKIVQVRTTCGCSVATLPRQPWVLAPGADGDFRITVDLRGKSGTLVKSATIDTPTSFKDVTFIIDIPGERADETEAERRARALQLANTDRQAVFKGDCASCHAAPTIGRTGSSLFTAACGICHEAEHRAPMVPDLNTVGPRLTREGWAQIISHGKPNTLMPAFAEAHGGPLSASQVESLVEYLISAFGRESPQKR